MRLHFLVSSYLNIYLWDPVKEEALVGNTLLGGGGGERSIADKKCHLMTVDKLVAKMRVGDTFMD
jgi:hypothetical protein